MKGDTKPQNPQIPHRGSKEQSSGKDRLFTLFGISLVSILLFSSFASAGASAAGAIVIMNSNNNQPAAGQGNSGCMPPIYFAKNNSCKLQYDGRYAVNSYTCSIGYTTYYLEGDCQGSGTITRNYTYLPPKIFESKSDYWLFAAPLMIIVFLVWLVGYMRRRNYG